MDPDYRGFRPPNPFKVTDLSGIIPDTRTTRPGSEQSISSGSTEFQAALDTFSRMKINETKRQEEETTKSVEESIRYEKIGSKTTKFKRVCFSRYGKGSI